MAVKVLKSTMSL